MKLVYTANEEEWRNEETDEPSQSQTIFASLVKRSMDMINAVGANPRHNLLLKIMSSPVSSPNNEFQRYINNQCTEDTTNVFHVLN